MSLWRNIARIYREGDQDCNQGDAEAPFFDRAPATWEDRRMAKTMRALAASAYGSIENSKVVELPIPEPGPGEVRVRVMASALNPADGKTLLGQIKLLHAKVFPLVVGWDLSGVVDAVGSGPTDLRVGLEVFGFHAYSRST